MQLVPSGTVPLKLIVWPALALSMLLVVGSCSNDKTPPTAPAEDLRVRFNLQTLGPIPYPPDNPPRQERIALGRMLFFDPILGGERDVACGTCHHPAFGFADSRQFGAGVSGQGLGPSRLNSSSAMAPFADVALEPRNSPTVLNAAFNADESGFSTHEGFQFMDGRVKSLEVQATKPITSRVEMRGDAYPGTDAEATAVALDSVLERLRAIQEYVARFQVAFPAEQAEVVAGTRANVLDSSTYARAIGSYERELVTRNSAYDRFVLGDDNALNADQKKGLELFFTKGRCSTCHSGPMFSNYEFIVQGVPQEGTGKVVLPGDDAGREEFTHDPVDRFAFRTLTLRNVALTAPYMHDGVFGTLREVVQFYNNACQPRHPLVSDGMIDQRLVQPLGLTDQEINQVVAFLEALTDPGTALNPVLLTVPASVPSGLEPVFGVKGPGPGVATLPAHSEASR